MSPWQIFRAAAADPFPLKIISSCSEHLHLVVCIISSNAPARFFLAALAFVFTSFFKIQIDELMDSVPSLQPYTRAPFFIWLNGYMPILVMIAVLSAAPPVFSYWAYRFEYTKTESQISREVFWRYSVLLITSTYVTVLSGSVLGSLQAITENPSQVVQDFAAALPGVSVYFTSFIIYYVLLIISIIRLG